MTPDTGPDLSHIHPDLRALALPLDSLTPDPRNARKHSATNLEAIRVSLVRWGMREPIVVQRGSNGSMTIRAGNGRTQVARELGWTHLPAIVVDEGDTEAIAFALADNRTAELAEWDPEVLGAHLADLQVAGLRLDAWDQDELAGLVGALEAPQAMAQEAPVQVTSEDEPDEDQVPEVIPTRTALGDVVQIGPHVLHCADCLEVMRGLPDNSVDAIVTDPPYGLSPDGRARTWDEIDALRAEGKGPKAGFMGRAWDAGVPGVTWARECLRVLKPGGHLVAFSATRTVHRLTCALEDVGFEIRDQIVWVQFQGFPKSLDVSKAIDDQLDGVRTVEVGRRVVPDGSVTMPHFAVPGVPRREYIELAPATPEAQQWAGWGTALKPSIEPITLARKPLSESTVAANVLRWGTGALNIDACRIPPGDLAWPGPGGEIPEVYGGEKGQVQGPAGKYGNSGAYLSHVSPLGRWPGNLYACPKPSGGERNRGTEDLPAQRGHEITGRAEGLPGSTKPRAGRRSTQPAGNTHATVKPGKIMRWLVRLVTPPGGTVLEPFGGSGTTGVAAAGVDCKVILTEREPGYCDIIRARVEHSLGTAVTLDPGPASIDPCDL